MSMRTMSQALAGADEEQTLFLSPEQATKSWIGSGEDSFVPYVCPFTVEELEWEDTSV